MKEFEKLEEEINYASRGAYGLSSINPSPLLEAWEAYKANLFPRPIEEAPRDGNPALVYFEYGVYGGWRVVQFEEGAWADHEGRFVEGNPIHWLPLPSMDGGKS